MRGSGLACAALAALAGAAEAQEESNKASNVAGEIVVTATRSEEDPLEVPASVASQSFDELRLLGFTYGSEEFRGVPGVFVRRGEGNIPGSIRDGKISSSNPRSLRLSTSPEKRPRAWPRTSSISRWSSA